MHLWPFIKLWQANMLSCGKQICFGIQEDACVRNPRHKVEPLISNIEVLVCHHKQQEVIAICGGWLCRHHMEASAGSQSLDCPDDHCLASAV